MSEAFYDDDNFSDEFTPDKDLKLGVWTQLLAYARGYQKTSSSLPCARSSWASLRFLFRL